MPGRGRAACTLSLVLSLSGLACEQPSGRAPDPARPPHVVLFLADDLGWGDVGYHGSPIRTPTIDRLRATGVELDRFYVQPSCSPTRAALLTGRYPIRYGLQTGVIRPWAGQGLDLGERLLPEALKGAGYATHIVGKWHLGCARVEELPTRRGFDHHYGLYTGKADSYTRERLGALDWHRDEEPLREEGYTTHLLRDEAVRVVRAHDPATPLFLFVPFSAPHFPLQDPPEGVGEYATTIADPDRRTYAAMVTCMDEAMGAVLAALEDRGMLASTLVIFLSDNGASLEHGGSNGTLASDKNEIGEGGVRVPAVLAWPGALAPGRVSERLHAVDLYPTLLGLAGLPPQTEPALDGLDLWPLLARGEPLGREVVLVNVAPNRGAVLEDGWKLAIDYVARQEVDLEASPLTGIELYDLEADPGETKNLAATALDGKRHLLAVLARYKAEMAPQPADRPSAMPEGYPVPEVWGPR